MSENIRATIAELRDREAALHRLILGLEGFLGENHAPPAALPAHALETAMAAKVATGHKRSKAPQKKAASGNADAGDGKGGFVGRLLAIRNRLPPEFTQNHVQLVLKGDLQAVRAALNYQAVKSSKPLLKIVTPGKPGHPAVYRFADAAAKPVKIPGLDDDPIDHRQALERAERDLARAEADGSENLARILRDKVQKLRALA